MRPGAPLLVLASGSATRAQMLRAAGLTIATETPGVDEEAVKQALTAEGVAPRDIADALAEMKALKVSARRPDALVIGADSTIVCDGRQFDRPETMAQARAQLLALRGRTHVLTSAVVVAARGQAVWRHVEDARLAMRAFSDSFLEAYLAALGEKALSSVGVYQTEGLGAQLFARIEGDWFAILGLPLLPLLAYLRERSVLER